MRFHAYWQSVTENEVFMIIKLDAAINAVSPFWIIFVDSWTSQSASLNLLFSILADKYNDRTRCSDTSLIWALSYD